MKTIIFSTGQPHSGLANYVINLMPEFKKQNYPVEVYQFVYWKKKKYIEGAKQLFGINFMQNNWFLNDVLGIRDLKIRRLALNDVKIIHFPEPMGLPSLKVLNYLKKKNVEIICTVRDLIDAKIGKSNYHVDENFVIKILRKILKKDPSSRSTSELIRLSKINKIICISENTKKDLIEMFDKNSLTFNQKKIFVVHHGINHDLFKKSRATKKELRKAFELPLNKKIIICNSSEEPRKNIKTLYSALALLPEEYILVRNGQVSKESINLINELEIEKRVFFFKDLSNQKYVDLINASDIFVLPTTYEGFCNPPLEAQACGIPVVTTHKTSLKEVIRDSAIILKNPYDSNELKNKIMSVFSDDKLKENLIKLGLNNSKRFSWKKDCEETIKIYKKL